MRIKVAYCKYLRKDGTVNSCTIDTEKKTYTPQNDARFDVFIEAAISKDVDRFREKAKENGYTVRLELYTKGANRYESQP